MDDTGKMNKVLYMPGQKRDYYAENPNRKGRDFILGFIGMALLLVLINVIIFGFVLKMVTQNSTAMSTVSILNVILNLVIFIGGLILAYSSGRRFIGIGISSLVLIPLLIFGACMIIITGFNGRLFGFILVFF